MFSFSVFVLHAKLIKLCHVFNIITNIRYPCSTLGGGTAISRAAESSFAPQVF